jgi:hypothetical protein
MGRIAASREEPREWIKADKPPQASGFFHSEDSRASPSNRGIEGWIAEQS